MELRKQFLCFYLVYCYFAPDADGDLFLIFFFFFCCLQVLIVETSNGNRRYVPSYAQVNDEEEDEVCISVGGRSARVSGFRYTKCVQTDQSEVYCYCKVCIGVRYRVSLVTGVLLKV